MHKYLAIRIRIFFFHFIHNACTYRVNNSKIYQSIWPNTQTPVNLHAWTDVYKGKAYIYMYSFQYYLLQLRESVTWPFWYHVTDSKAEAVEEKDGTDGRAEKRSLSNFPSRESCVQLCINVWNIKCISLPTHFKCILFSLFYSLNWIYDWLQVGSSAFNCSSVGPVHQHRLCDVCYWPRETPKKSNNTSWQRDIKHLKLNLKCKSWKWSFWRSV